MTTGLGKGGAERGAFGRRRMIQVRMSTDTHYPKEIDSLSL
jgi:hypothetical protein